MQQRIDKISNSLTPFFTKLNSNVWLSSLQHSIQTLLPFIFVGSIALIFSKIQVFVPTFPDLSPMTNFLFGLLGLLLAYFFPSTLLSNKKIQRFHALGGFTTMGLYLMMDGMKINANSIATFDFGSLGAGGMFVAIVLGIFVSLVMIFFSKHSFFKNNDALPDIIITWFDSLLPIIICFVVGWILAFQLNFHIFDVLRIILKPLLTGSNTYIGYMMLILPGILLYAFGISSWAIAPIVFPIILANTAANAAAGDNATSIATFELLGAGYISMGGSGNTLPLNIMMLFSKSKQIKALGRAAIAPSLFNINEPIIFGMIALNPIMMIGFILVGGIIGPTLMYAALKIGLIPISHQVFTMQFLPFPISTFVIANNSIIGPIFAVIMLVIVYVLYLPFFKIYENMAQKKEAAELAEENRDDAAATQTD